MTGSVALDVVIGLIFIYLLYSLFATVIMEIVNTFLGLRARNLRYALRRMLMDEKISGYAVHAKQTEPEFMVFMKNTWNLILLIPSKLGNTILKTFGVSSNLSNPGLFHSFYAQPSIKYLSAGGFANKPSYIAPQNFSKTIMDTIKENHHANGILNRIDDSLLESLNAAFEVATEDNQLKRKYKEYLKKAKKGKEAKKDEEQNSLSFKDWFSQLEDTEKIQGITGLTQVSPDLKAQLEALKDSVKGESLLEKIKEGIAMLPEGSDTKKHLESLLVDAQNDLEKFKYFLEQWFNDSMERATGWFKRRAQFFLFLIGFVLAVSFNANTFDTIKKLSADPEAREQLVQLAIEYSDDLKERNNDNQNPPNPNDSLLTDENERITKANDSLLKVADSLRADIYKAQNIIATNWRIPNTIKIQPVDSCDKKTAPKKNGDSITFTFPLKIKKKGVGKKNYPKECVSVKVHKTIDKASFISAISPTTRAAFNEGVIKVKMGKYKRKYVFKMDGLNFKNLWGYVLTALAISMGSPFWFDLLNKLINLRNSIRPKKEDKQEPNSAGGATLVNRVG